MTAIPGYAPERLSGTRLRSAPGRVRYRRTYPTGWAACNTVPGRYQGFTWWRDTGTDAVSSQVPSTLMRAPALTVLGLDAATFDVLDPLLEAGQLPALARLFDAGSRGTLRSTIHPLTSQAWATMVTGVNAGRHGLWDFAERDESGYQLRLVNGSYPRGPGGRGGAGRPRPPRG